jgi:hypothetical protein
MLGMLKRHEVEILLKAGHPKTEAACLAGVSLRSVKRIAGEVPVIHADDAAEREQRRIGRPSIVENFRKFILEIFEQTPELPSLEVLRSPHVLRRTPFERLISSGIILLDNTALVVLP